MRFLLLIVFSKIIFFLEIFQNIGIISGTFAMETATYLTVESIKQSSKRRQLVPLEVRL